MVQRVDELERIADPIAVLAFRITAIRLVLRARGEEAAGVPRRRRAGASVVHEIRECSRVALAHHRDDLNLPCESIEQQTKLADSELLVPERDRAAAGTGPSGTAMVRHEHEQTIAWEDLALRRVEPLTQLREPRRMELHRTPGCVDELNGRLQTVAEAGVLDQPEVGWRRVALRQVRGRFFAIGGEDVDALGRDASLTEQLHHLLEVLEVTEVVRRWLTAAVDQERVDGAGTRARAPLALYDRRGREPQRREGEHQRASKQLSIAAAARM